MALAPGTTIEGSSDPRTVEQNAALRRMQTENGEVGSQYAGCIICPDGTVTRDRGIINMPAARVAEITAVLNAAGKTNADGKTVSGGYLLFLNTEAIPVQYYGVSASKVQTGKDLVTNSILTPAEQSAGISHRTAIALARNGLQTDGTPVTDSYLTLIEKWADQEGVDFTRPNPAYVAALSRPAPASVVVTSGQGVAATPVGGFVVYSNPQPAPMQIDAPTFTSGMVLPEDFTPAPLRSPTYVPQQNTTAMPTLLAAETTTAPTTTPAQDQSVVAAKTRTMYIVAGVIAALAVAYAMGKK